MTAPIGGFGGPGNTIGPRRIGLDIAGENGMSRLQPPAGGESFGDTLKRALGQVSNAQDVSQDYMDRFVRGEPVELHQVMAAAEEASISLEMLVELRNKLMDAYKTVTQMG
jgi:flagellar hook-basal body complex protein FliE